MIRNKTRLLLPILVLLFIASPVGAEADAEVDITVEVATEVETTSDEENLEVVEDGEIIDITLEDLEVEDVDREPSRFSLFFRNIGESISLGITRDPIKKAEKQQKFALRAEKLSEFLFENGKIEQAEKALEKSNKFIEKIEERKEKWINSKDERAEKLLKNVASHQLHRENFLDKIEDKIPEEKLEQFQQRREIIIQKNQRLLNAINNENISEEVREHLQKVKDRIEAHAVDLREHKEEVRELRASGDKEGLKELRKERKEGIQDKREENKELIQEKRIELKSKAENGDEEAQKRLRILNNNQQKVGEEREEKRQDTRANIQEKRQDVRENIQEKIDQNRPLDKKRAEPVRPTPEQINQNRIDTRTEVRTNIELKNRVDSR